MRVGFTLIGGRAWTGGYNYLLNLVSVLAEHQPGSVQPVLFFGTDTDEADAGPFQNVDGVEVVHSPLMNQNRKLWALTKSVVFGHDSAIQRLFANHRVDVLFENASFYGARLGLGSIAWLPDFQHRAIPRNFTTLNLVRRELGFRAQIAGGRTIMLSSEDSRTDCERYYPATRGNTAVVRFAVPASPVSKRELAREVAATYGLRGKYFVLPNQFFQHKNHLVVLEALALLRQRGFDLVVAATGQQSNYFPVVQRRLTELALQRHFRPLGMVPYRDLQMLMHASVALINPSLFEGWSTPVEEARSLGVPMILSDLRVHREQAGVHALYFDPRSAEALAATLSGFRPLSEDERRERTEGAQQDAAVRVRRFAEDFVRVARHAHLRNRSVLATH